MTGSPSSSKMRPVTTPPLTILTVAVAWAPGLHLDALLHNRSDKAGGVETMKA